MDADTCKLLATRLRCSASDVAASYYGNGNESDAYTDNDEPDKGDLHSGDYEKFNKAMIEFFGQEIFDFLENLDTFPGMFDHVMAYITTGEYWPASGGRHFTVLSEKGQQLAHQARAKFVG